MQTTVVIHNAEEFRYEILKDGVEIGSTDYRLLPADDGEPAIAEFHHTVITTAERNQGHAERLVAAALDDIRSRGLRIKPTCWYVDQFVVEHSDYADLRA